MSGFENAFHEAIDLNSEAQGGITENEWEKIREDKNKILSNISDDNMKSRFENRYAHIDNFFQKKGEQVLEDTHMEYKNLKNIILSDQIAHEKEKKEAFDYFPNSSELLEVSNMLANQTGLDLGMYLIGMQNTIEEKLQLPEDSPIDRVKYAQFIENIKTSVSIRLQNIMKVVEKIKVDMQGKVDQIVEERTEKNIMVEELSQAEKDKIEDEVFREHRWIINEKIQDSFSFITNQLIPTAQGYIAVQGGKRIDNKYDKLEDYGTGEEVVYVNHKYYFDEFEDILDAQVDEDGDFDEGFFSTQNLFDITDHNSELLLGDLGVKKEKLTMLSVEDKKTDDIATVGSLCLVGLMCIPYAGAIPSAVIDLQDIFSSEDETVNMLKTMGVVPQEYKMSKEWYHNALAILGVAGSPFGLQAAAKLKKLAVLMGKMKSVDLDQGLVNSIIKTITDKFLGGSDEAKHLTRNTAVNDSLKLSEKTSETVQDTSNKVNRVLSRNEGLTQEMIENNSKLSDIDRKAGLQKDIVWEEGGDQKTLDDDQMNKVLIAHKYLGGKLFGHSVAEVIGKGKFLRGGKMDGNIQAQLIKTILNDPENKLLEPDIIKVLESEPIKKDQVRKIMDYGYAGKPAFKLEPDIPLNTDFLNQLDTLEKQTKFKNDIALLKEKIEKNLEISEFDLRNLGYSNADALKKSFEVEGLGIQSQFERSDLKKTIRELEDIFYQKYPGFKDQIYINLSDKEESFLNSLGINLGIDLDNLGINLDDLSSQDNMDKLVNSFDSLDTEGIYMLDNILKNIPYGLRSEISDLVYYKILKIEEPKRAEAAAQLISRQKEEARKLQVERDRKARESLEEQSRLIEEHIAEEARELEAAEKAREARAAEKAREARELEVAEKAKNPIEMETDIEIKPFDEAAEKLYATGKADLMKRIDPSNIVPNTEFYIKARDNREDFIENLFELKNKINDSQLDDTNLLAYLGIPESKFDFVIDALNRGDQEVKDMLIKRAETVEGITGAKFHVEGFPKIETIGNVTNNILYRDYFNDFLTVINSIGNDPRRAYIELRFLNHDLNEFIKQIKPKPDFDRMSHNEIADLIESMPKRKEELERFGFTADQMRFFALNGII